MYEIVRSAEPANILCQGRGSAANSAVCFCLGITAVDPVRMDLLFERFLSRERAEPPDIDLDIEHERREEVIQHVYAKLRPRPRRDGVQRDPLPAASSAVRDVGKALGLPETALDRAAKLLSSWGDVEPAALAKAAARAAAPSRGCWPSATRSSSSRATCRSTPAASARPRAGARPGADRERHACRGAPSSSGTRTISRPRAVQGRPAGAGRAHQLHRCFDLLREHRGVELTMATIARRGSDTYDMICAADTVGVFQIESRAQMAMLPRLRPRTFYDLVIEVSIVRPGPIRAAWCIRTCGGATGEERSIYPHPSLEPVLEKTLGVPLFQEQVMKLAVVAADYTPGEADQLRRDMAAWRARAASSSTASG
jgi:error-prone DNA polymerase